MEKKLSLIIPIYNAEPFLRRLFENLEAQDVFFDDEEFGEVIFVNDASTDNSTEIIKEYGKKHTWVKLINSNQFGVNQGQHIARNSGMAIAKGEYIAFMDQDDAYTPGALRRLISVGDNDKSDVIRGGFLKIDNSEFYSWKNMHIAGLQNHVEKYGLKIILESGDLHCHNFVWSSLYRKSFITKHSVLFDPRIRCGEDLAFIWLVMLKDPKVSVIDNVTYLWIQRDDSDSHNKDHSHLIKMKSYAESIAIFMKEQYHNYKSNNNYPDEIKKIMLRGSHWACYKYLGSLIYLKGIRRTEVSSTIKRIKEKGIYPYPHIFPKNLPYGYPKALKFRIMWRLLSYEWILRTFLYCRSI